MKIKSGSTSSPASAMGTNVQDDKFSWQQWKILILLICLHLVRAMGKSLQPPFYPPEAASKGITPAGNGLVFGTYELTMFLICPFLAKIINKTGYIVSIHLGMLLTGMCYISMGLLDLSTSPDTFLYMSLMTRVVEAVGSAIVYMGVFAVVLATFPNSVASTYATIEFFYGIGTIAGPIFGALLIQSAGFILPFAVIGFLMLTLGYLAPCIVPPDLETATHLSRETDKMNVKCVWRSVKITAIQVHMLCIAVTMSVYSFYGPVLQPHLQRFTVSPLEESLTFVFLFGTAMVAAPLAGLLCDIGVPGLLLTIPGLIAIFTGSILIGPAPFLNIKVAWPGCAAGMIVAGLGMACVLGACFVDGINTLIQHGYDDDLETFGLMTALFSASYTLGGLVGPFASGLLYDSLGFRASTYFVLVSVLFALGVIMAYTVVGALGTNNSTLSVEQAKEVTSDSRRNSALAPPPPVSPLPNCTQDCIYGSVDEVFY